MSGKKIVRAEDVMKSDFVEVDGLMTVAQALDIARESRARVLIVKKRHEDDEFGMVLLSDIAKKVIACDRSADRVNVYEIMAKPTIGVKGRMDVRYCARLFENVGISLAPVIDEDQIRGIVSYNDIVLDGLFAEQQ
ncbi:CBS domain-containing protein [Motiliproteus coralliicola]|uniref:CBS domain-containing protein n=1 Tax=Motiliproteus coralliicola TaxID=2283196 RepID=A0A369WSA7_9GAMM|nr:CBS domain-containing protein [Motiliproteus coralliicola]RDE24988.1 CBS domain-containing protein [Motiliproteus coralliicola]